MIHEFDINTVVNYLFIGAIAWIRSLEVRLRQLPQYTINCVESYTNKQSHRMDRLEDRMDKILSLQLDDMMDKMVLLQEEYLKKNNQSS